MDFNLKDRRVAVTGAGDGIGRAIAQAFASAGARVAGCARNEDRLQDLARAIDGKGHLFAPADVRKVEDIQAFHGKIMETFGGVDVLVNNVGSILKTANFLELSDDDWLESFQTNLMTAVRTTRAFIPALKNSGSPRIVNVSSIAARGPGERFPHYSAMKAALSNLTVSLAKTLAPDNILVNSVSPGPVWTRSWEVEAQEMARKSGVETRTAQDLLKAEAGQATLLKRIGIPEDVAGTVLFLASDHSRWITAANFTADGGMTGDPF
ncbi:MAG: SDR family oxidoreductase [Nitrospinae bacterium]|nr:SDR family oxidoreductase [Nitrospinota bacterium]